MGEYDDLIPKPSGGASTGSGDYDDLLPSQSGGAFAAKELAPGQDVQGERRRKLMELVAAKGEPGYGTRLVDNFTMGLNRPLGGVASVLGGGSWKAGVGAEEDYVKRAEANTNPVAGAAVDVLGGLASGGPVKSLVKGAATAAQQAPAKLQQLGKLMLSGAGSGAIEGAARNAESVPNALVGAGVGGAAGGVTSGVVGALTDRLAGKAAREAVAEATERGGGSKVLKDEGGAIYQKLDNAGISFKDATPLVQGSVNRMAKEGFNPEIHKELTPVLTQIAELEKKPATWTQLQNIRTQISDAKASDDKRVRKMAGHLSDVLDDFVEKTKPTIPARSVGIDVGGDAKAAKDLWRRGSQAENVEWLAEKGMYATKDKGRKLETNFSGEVDKVNNPKRFSTHQNNPEQVDALKAIATGSPKTTATANMLDKFGNQLLGYGSAGLATGLGSVAALGDPSGVGSGLSGAGTVAMLLGGGSKVGSKVASRIAANQGGERVNSLIRNIVGSNATSPARDDLAKILAAEQLKLGAGRYSSNFFDKE